ncbi:hypothetical protein PYW07_006397 [Mythimna separata]|uniref:Probable deoxycytidylate deaminase n=1 Tax=Mythimna separata TaxID=271217 RepID=A0AAD7YUF4_MYTSE|nr:hypothetical protein PYW07_006397 [Mythimna separata]
MPRITRKKQIELLIISDSEVITVTAAHTSSRLFLCCIQYTMASGNEQNKSANRLHVIDWQTYFMASAFLARHRSKDPHCQVGACIVNDDNKIIGTGYNGLPMGFDDDEFLWAKRNESKYAYVCHAVTNAIIFRNTSNVKGCTIYVTLFPSNECAKLIIQSGIKKVIYFTDVKNEGADLNAEASKRMFEAANVEYKQYEATYDFQLTFVKRQA